MKQIGLISLFSIGWLIFSCSNRPVEFIPVIEDVNIPLKGADQISDLNEISKLERTMIDSGLVDILTVDSTITVDLKYSTIENFMHQDLYGNISKCYVQKEVAEALSKAQSLLRSEFPYYSLLVFDGTRPLSIQQKMWDSLDVLLNEKTKFISNPANGSLHNYGAAIDLSLIDEAGIELDMGTPYDFMGELAYPRKENDLIQEGKLTIRQSANRDLLRKVMKNAGFSSISTEWWHFNYCSREEAKKRFALVK